MKIPMLFAFAICSACGPGSANPLEEMAKPLAGTSVSCFALPTIAGQAGTPPFRICEARLRDTSVVVIRDASSQAVGVNRRWNETPLRAPAQFAALTAKIEKQYNVSGSPCLIGRGLIGRVWKPAWGQTVAWTNTLTGESGIASTLGSNECLSSLDQLRPER
jgi:hypothetical protein